MITRNKRNNSLMTNSNNMSTFSDTESDTESDFVKTPQKASPLKNTPKCPKKPKKDSSNTKDLKLPVISEEKDGKLIKNARKILFTMVEKESESSEDLTEDSSTNEDLYEDLDPLEDALDDEDIETLRLYKKTDPFLYEKFKNAKDLIKSREISLKDILTANLSDDKRATLIELYECFRQLYPGTQEYIDSRNCIKTLFNRYVEISKEVEKTNPNLEKETYVSEADIFRKKIKDLTCSSENRKVLEEKVDEFEDSCREDKSKTRTWLKTATSLPFDKISYHSYDIKQKLKETYDYISKKLYGMENVKERIMLFLNKKLHQKETKGCNLALVGIPGSGKTSILRCISHVLKIPFTQINFGGMSNADFLLGHDFTYISSRQGEISRCLTRMGSKNGIIYMDEFNRISDKKEIMSTLLHITDFTQNHEFRDNYHPELVQDLSKIWFVYSMNHLPEDKALADRLEVINVEGYLPDERNNIAKEYIFKKIVEEMNLNIEVKIVDEAYTKIVTMTGEGRQGIRNLERYINLIIEKSYFFLCNLDMNTYNYKWYIKMQESYQKSGKKSLTITEDIVSEILKDYQKEEVFHNMYM